MKKKNEKTFAERLKGILIAIILPAIILIVWQYVSKAEIVNPNALPAPSDIFLNIFTLIEKGQLQIGLKISFWRVALGFSIGVGLGVALGFVMGLLKPIEKLLSSIISVLRPMPLMALIPVFIVTLGIGETTNIAVIAIGTLWPTLLNTITGIHSTNPKLLELARVYRISRIKTIFGIVLPSATTSIITGVRLSAGVAWSSVVAAEMIGASSGIGYMIMYAREVARSTDLFSCVIIIGVIGLIIEKLLLALQNIFNRKFNGIV